MVKYQQYAEYKDSGVEWLGKIPKDWELKRIQESTSIINGYPFVSSKFNPTKGMPLVRIRDIRHQKTEVCFDGVVPEAAVINNDDILIGMDGDFNVAKWTGGMAALNQRVACIRHKNPIIQSFLYYLLPYHMKIVNDLTYYTTVKHLSSNDILKTTFALPSENELKNIVSFLNHETAQIDTLIEKQQTLIQLLKEKRQAMISHAVTKGLNPDATMKDSGVEWLGEVPEHWINIQLGRVCRQVSDGPHFSPAYVDEGVMFLSARNIGVDAWYLDDAKFISEKDYKEFCRRVVPEKGDVLYTKGGTTGVARVVDLDQPFQVWVHVAVLKLRLDLINPNYAAFVLNSIGCYEQSQLHTRGATNQDLGLTRMVKIWFALPSIEEQNAILDFLNQKVSKIDALINNAYTGINLLKERRTALISAAVTGKIDVRGWQAPE